ncbi:hypothetical protein FCV25MIE_29658, partial [Fagus crenata]
VDDFVGDGRPKRYARMVWRQRQRDSNVDAQRRSETITDADLVIPIILALPPALRKGHQCCSRPHCRRWRRRDHSVLPFSLLCLWVILSWD